MLMKKEQIIRSLVNITIGTEFDGRIYLAGGCVRDEILGIRSNDIDILVDGALNAGIMFANFLHKEIPWLVTKPIIFPTYGTAMVHFGGTPLEFIAPRIEKYNPNSRNPSVYTGALQDDVYRRDFTINSLLRRISDGELLDLTNSGLKDLEEGVIRTPLTPSTTFNDDPLRMLRAVRFAAKYPFWIADSTYNGIKENVERINIVSKERIREELNKILMLNGAGSKTKAFKTLNKTGLLPIIIPALSVLEYLDGGDYHNKNPFDHSLDVLERIESDSLELRLAALFHDLGKCVTEYRDSNGKIHYYDHESFSDTSTLKVMDGLRYSNEQIKLVRNLVANHMRTKNYGEFGEKVTDKTLRKLKGDILDMNLFLELVHADNCSHHPDYCLPNQAAGIIKRLHDLKDEPNKPKLPINGNDIMDEFNLKPSPKVGELKAIIEDKWLENPSLTRQMCIDLLKQHIKQEDEVKEV